MIQNIQELGHYAINNGDLNLLILSEPFKTLIDEINRNLEYWIKNQNSHKIYNYTFNDSNTIINFQKYWLEAGFSNEFCQLLLHSACRPKINLKILCSKLNIDIPAINLSTRTIVDNQVLNDIRSQTLRTRRSADYVIPVIRYEYSNPKIYHSSVVYSYPPHIPTFYYFEQQSPWYLCCDNLVYAPNKVQMCEKLGASQSQIRTILTQKLSSHITIPEINELFNLLISTDPNLVPDSSMSLEHVLDDFLTALLRAHKIQVCILGKMENMGKFEVEIMDVRLRQESFSNICISESWE